MMRFAGWSGVFACGRFVFHDVAFVVHLLRHGIARVTIGAGVDGFGCEKQSRRDDANDGSKTPALFVRIVGAHENETGNGSKRDGGKVSGETDMW